MYVAFSGMSIRTISTREVYRNKWLRLREDHIERLYGDQPPVPGLYSVIDKDPCAAIIAIEHDQQLGEVIYLVEQFRYSIQEQCLELPQGGWEEDVTDHEALARGELREETGVVAEKMTYLGMLWIAYGFANQKQHIYLAEGLSAGEVDRDAEEHDLVVHRVPVVEFEEMMRSGKIQDASTLAAWALYKLRT